MRRVILLGRGGAGKSTLARKIGAKLGIPVTELDKVFWGPDLTPMDIYEWTKVQNELCQKESWILDGDLGKYDALSVRLRHCHTVILLDFPLVICALRVFRRSRERMDFWVWLTTWRKRERPKILCAIRNHAPQAELIVLKGQKAVDKFVQSIEQ